MVACVGLVLAILVFPTAKKLRLYHLHPKIVLGTFFPNSEAENWTLPNLRKELK